MANTLHLPFLNPVPMYEQNPTVLAQYVSKHMDLFPYIETVAPWQTARPFYQPWQIGDHIRLQYQSNYGPITLKLIDGYERVYITQPPTQVAINDLDPTLAIYENDIVLTGLPDGFYFLLLEVGNDGTGKPVTTLVSEPLKILATQPNTLYLEYKHYKFKGTVVFETGFFPALRIPGRLPLKSPAAKDTFFEDEELSQRLIDGRPYRVHELQVGGASGIPDWIAIRLNHILSCSYTSFDGRQFTKNGQQDMQPSAEKGYPLRSWSLDMRDTENKDAVTYTNGAVNSGPDSYIISVDRNGFGGATSGEEQILEIG